MAKNIVLVGFMGTGKTSTGKSLAVKLKREFMELDNIIEQKEGVPIREIFERKGEAYFRNIETQIVREVSLKTDIVISAGGGAVIDEENIVNLKKTGIVICLKASPCVIIERTRGHKTRPLLNVPDPKSRIEELLKKRESNYGKADYCVDTDGLTPEEVADNIIKVISL